MSTSQKKLCITSFVFGDKYQDYVPLFIFSMKKAYPEYDIIIFLHDEVKEHVQEQLEYLTILGSFKIIENYHAEVNFSTSPLHGAALRWILWDESFQSYDAIYVADIDIFYCKEDMSLLDQHLIHCQTIQKPFSNIKRKPLYVKPYSLRTFALNLKKTSILFTLKTFFFGTFVENKLTGLHFYLRKDYVSIVKPFYKKYEKMICNFDYNLHHSKGFNDESLLYDIIEEAGLSESLPTMTTDYEMLTNSPYQPVFRPHHGIHLGIFRDSNYPDYQIEILSTNIYKMYYKQFCRLEQDDIFKKLIPFFSKNMKEELSNMHSFYNK